METVAQALSNHIAELEGAGLVLPAGVMHNLKESLKDLSGATSAQTILSLKDTDDGCELKTVEGQTIFKHRIRCCGNFYCKFSSNRIALCDLFVQQVTRGAPTSKRDFEMVLGAHVGDISDD